MDLDLYLCRFADAVYCAQFNAVALVKPICHHVSWLPLGCSTKWHRSENTSFLYDISFIGGVNDVKRGKYLNFLKERYAGRSFIGRADKSDIGKIYSGSRIAFNISSNNDINMRFFEVLCSGALLVTERVQNNGMEQLLQGIDKPVCLFFDTLEEAAFLIDYYLEHEEEREAIAKRGRSFAESQTYVSRMKAILEDSTSVQSMDANMISYLSNCIMLTIREKALKILPGSTLASSKGLSQMTDYHSLIRKDVLRICPPGLAKKVLEVGCGTGETLAYMKRMGFAKHVTGIERSSACVGRVNPDVDAFLHMDAEQFEPNEQYSGILLLDVLEHLVEPFVLLKRLVSCLAPNGYILISIPNYRNLGILKSLIFHGRVGVSG